MKIEMLMIISIFAVPLGLYIVTLPLRIVLLIEDWILSFTPRKKR